MSIIRFYGNITIVSNTGVNDLKSTHAFFGKTDSVTVNTKSFDSFDECKINIEGFVDATLKKYKKSNKNKEFFMKETTTVDSNCICTYHLFEKDEEQNLELVTCNIMVYDLDFQHESISSALH